jgi:alkanesulfonate monooxygenase SsuD/methylene tetrahydromethanopterin reductase-like flavin-dependent oxidoreductase (luciferase family)
MCTPWLAAAASATTSLRLGSYVHDNACRHPVLLVREAAEIDLLSSGGWNWAWGLAGRRTSTTRSASSTRARSPNHGAAPRPSALTPAAPASTV